MERMEQNPVGFHLEFFRLDLNMFASPVFIFYFYSAGMHSIDQKP